MKENVVVRVFTGAFSVHAEQSLVDQGLKQKLMYKNHRAG